MSAVRFVIDKSVDIIGYFLKDRIINNPYKNKDGYVCVNLGCGLAVTPGWINVDASLNALFAGTPVLLLNFLYRISGSNRYYKREVYTSLLRANRFVFHDLSRSLPFTPKSVDYFYSSHFFEHLFKADAVRLLREIKNALKKEGVMRIAIPDLSYAVSLYQNGEKEKMLDNYFFVNDRSSYLARHKYMYDFELFNKLLSEIGFRNIEKCAMRSGKVPNLNELDNRPGDTVFIEATV